MRIILFSLITLLSLSLSQAQSDDIDIIKEEKAGSTTFFAKNNTKDALTVEFTIEGTGFTTDNGNTVTVSVKPLAKQSIVTVTAIPGQSTSYSMGYKYYKGNSNSATSSSTMEKPIQGTITQEDLKNGIVVFSKNGCGRCSYAVKYLSDNNIPFKEVNISENKTDASLMWAQLEKAGFGGGSVQTPVISVNGTLNHQLPDLKSFLSTLK